MCITAAHVDNLQSKIDMLHDHEYDPDCKFCCNNEFVKAAEQDCDAYISGEVSERTFYEAKELGVHYFACGHHATERYGVQRLGQAISEQFDIEYVYFELNNPI